MVPIANIMVYEKILLNMIIGVVDSYCAPR